ncbi:hypothetical protein F2Q68_00019289 [Brassica cretica]|uniref:Uncharacterized protein n=2 Tax=Brassica cretica TaxID=69181 RepID=A0A8S9G9N2_BRACR|nr:hypothetical protein F2Q68_00019289 [Brassica cretica]KAF3504490.1 hypothetical protein F2Q69_00040561 [Brassica cretica]
MVKGRATRDANNDESCNEMRKQRRKGRQNKISKLWSYPRAMKESIESRPSSYSTVGAHRGVIQSSIRSTSYWRFTRHKQTWTSNRSADHDGMMKSITYHLAQQYKAHKAMNERLAELTTVITRGPATFRRQLFVIENPTTSGGELATSRQITNLQISM